ncbi:MAG: sensor domain-containing diguanylate cyclase [Deltaproteobacteria bacterium]|nr:sensor domain-containing diguanylate cyclase [Deltaproteobacteria bacterium]
MSSTNPPPPEHDDDLEKPVFSMRDLAFELEVTAAILRTLEIDQILYVVLSGVTSGEGLGFNRGLFMLVDYGQRALRTSMAIGPVHKADAHRIWEDMKAKELTLGALLTAYDKVKDDPTAHELTHHLGHLTIGMNELEQLAAQAVPVDATGTVPIQAMVARCLLAGEPMFSNTVQLACEESEDPFVFKNWGMVPLATPEHAVGVLVVDNAFSERVITIRENQLLIALANLTAIAVENGRLFARMRALAEVDGLTGVANRRTYDVSVQRMLTEARQTGRTLSLVIIDVDHFKQFNDRHGHLAGDDVLRVVASTLASNARKSDLVARYGGEEFAVLLPGTTLEQAAIVARKLVRAVEDAGDMPHGNVTISAGVACSLAGNLDATQLFEEADRAVYRAKHAGRNRVECAVVAS